MHVKGLLLIILFLMGAIAASNLFLLPKHTTSFENPVFTPQTFNRTEPDDPNRYIVTSLPVFPGNVDGMMLMAGGFLTCSAMILRSRSKF